MRCSRSNQSLQKALRYEVFFDSSSVRKKLFKTFLLQVVEHFAFHLIQFAFLQVLFAFDFVLQFIFLYKKLSVQIVCLYLLFCLKFLTRRRDGTQRRLSYYLVFFSNLKEKHELSKRKFIILLFQQHFLSLLLFLLFLYSLMPQADHRLI